MAKKYNSIKGMAPFEDSKWRAESDLRTLIEAAEIRKDKKRFAAAQACAKEKLAAMAGVAGAEPAKS